MVKLCSNCKQRPAVVYVSDTSKPNAEPRGLCLVCAKSLGFEPSIDSFLKKMNITDEDIENMSAQLMEMMSGDDNGEIPGFEMGGASVFPFLNNVFGDVEQRQNGAADAAADAKDKKDKTAAKHKSRKYIDMFCTNLNQRAKDGKLDNVIGRNKELDRTVQILCRRSKNNPCLIGEPGVGKTAIAEGLALRIVSGDAPARLLDKEIMLLDITGLVAGTQFRGQFESRVKGLVDEVKKQGNIILFVDEVHNLVGAGDSAEGSMNAGNILKPALSRGEIQMIGATTFKEYRKYIEKDAALERRFQPIVIEEPSIKDAQEILLGVKCYYEGYHNVTIPDDIALRAVVLSERYINDRYLPDKAIDLLDEACSCTSLRNKSVDDLYAANKKIAELAKREDELAANVENPDYEEQAKVKEERAKYQQLATELYLPASNTVVTEADLAKVIELWTGIPSRKVEESDFEKLKHIADDIKKQIIGQDTAVDLVAAAVKRSRVQTSVHRRPASFIFIGPTGVGKTELAKVLASQLFDTPETLIRLDMTEFMEKHSVSRIIGSPPGYVGYDEAGQLTEKVRRKPYSVVLFDEIEKAHPDVMNILLQILDDGRVTDAQGRTVNFENCIIIMTSNVGSDRSDALMGFGTTAKQASADKCVKALKEFLRPEFIARVDDIIVFDPLNEESLVKIADLMFSEFKDVMSEKNVDIYWDSDVCKYIARKADGKQTGARELRTIFRKEIEDKVVDIIISNTDSKLKGVKISVKDKEIKVEAIF